MFSTKKQLLTRTGFNNVGRYDYLKLLVTEFKTANSKEAKKQTLANLANFAYDPVNYDYFRQLRIIDLFLNILSDPEVDFVQFAIGGLCNLSSDPINRQYIIRNQGVELISELLISSEEESVLSAITTLMFLTTESSNRINITPHLITKLTNLSKSTSNRAKNLALIFLTDFCITNN